MNDRMFSAEPVANRLITNDLELQIANYDSKILSKVGDCQSSHGIIEWVPHSYSSHHQQHETIGHAQNNECHVYRQCIPSGVHERGGVCAVKNKNSLAKGKRKLHEISNKEAIFPNDDACLKCAKHLDKIDAQPFSNISNDLELQLANDSSKNLPKVGGYQSSNAIIEWKAYPYNSDCQQYQTIGHAQNNECHVYRQPAHSAIHEREDVCAVKNRNLLGKEKCKLHEISNKETIFANDDAYLICAEHIDKIDDQSSSNVNDNSVITGHTYLTIDNGTLCNSNEKLTTTTSSHQQQLEDNYHTPNEQVNIHSARKRQTHKRNITNRRKRLKEGPPSSYMYMGKCDSICQYCNACFWYDERIRYTRGKPQYHKFCNNGKVRLESHGEYPQFIKQLFTDRHFMENIRAYNQMFAMTSLGADIDDSINRGRGPYVFKVSGQIYHWIGALCPEENKRPRFLQLYIYDTENEVANRLEKFQKNGQGLRADIVQDLITFLDQHNRLVQLFRTTRDKMAEADIPKFTVHLFGVVGSKQYELPSRDSIGAIVFEGGPDVESEFDIIIEQHNGIPKRVNKLNPSYMSLHFPLIFIYGEDGY